VDYLRINVMYSYADQVTNCTWLPVLQEQLSRRNPSTARDCL